MKKMFSCSSNQVAVESWNKYDQKLFDAVEKGDVERVSALALKKKTARPTKLNALGQSAFHLAASRGLTECLSLLLACGAEVNDKNDDGSTALHLATIACQPQCVKVLLQHGANEDCVDREDRTPLHWAASSGCASSVLLLCDQEAFLDVADNHGRTPLMIAAQGNHPAICAQLLQRGAAVDLPDGEGKTALMLACESGSTEAAELLLQNGAHVGLADGAGRDALHYATRARSRPLRRLVRSALKRWKRREQGLDTSLESGSQVPSESGRETDVSSLTAPSEGGERSDGEEEEEEEDPELKEWRSRYRDEKMKVIQLELQLGQKARECEALAEGRKGTTERIWGQVQEISQLLLEEGGQSEDCGDPSRRYSRDATEEDYYLNLLAEQVQELKKRKVQQQEAREKGGPQMAAAGEPGGAPPRAATGQEEEARWPGEEEEEARKRQETEMKRLRAEVAAALEERASTARRVEEVEGHMENMRAVIGVYEAKKKSQSAALKGLEARVQELTGENEQLRGLLAKHLGASEKGGEPALGLAREEVSRFLAELEELCRSVQKETSAVAAENQALKGEAEDSLRSKLQFQAVPSGAVRRSVSAWKKAVAGLERVLAKTEQANATLLEKARSLREALAGAPSRVVVNGNGRHEENGALPGEGPVPPDGPKVPEQPEGPEAGRNHLQNGSGGQVRLRPKPDLAERKGRPCRRSADLEKEVWDLKQSNGSLVKELTQLSREREKLQEQLRSLSRPADGPSPAGSPTEELRQAVASLSQQLSAEKEEARALRLSLEAQRQEMVGVRDSFLRSVAQEAGGTAGESLDACILQELHWKLDSVVRKQNEALQLVSEMEEESLAREADRALLAGRSALPEAPGAGGDGLRARQRMGEAQAGLEQLREALEGAQASLGARGQELARVMQLLGRLACGMAELRREGEEALRRHEQVRAMLSLRAQALAEELAALREEHEAAWGASARDKEALASERQRQQALRTELARLEELAEELRGRSQAAEGAAEKLSRRVEELSRSCRDKDAKIKKLLKETEKLSSEVLNLRSERARLLLQNEVVQKNHQEIVAIYRTHLLNAAQGFMDEEVHAMLLRILRTNDS